MIDMPVDLSVSRNKPTLQHEIRIIESFDAFEALREEWNKLAATAQDCSLFMTYQYCELAAERLLAKNGIIAVAMVYEDFDLVALWPLGIQRTGWLRIARTLSSGMNIEYGGPLVKGEASSVVIAETLRAVMKFSADALELFMVQDGSLLQEALAVAPQSWLLPWLPDRMGRLPSYAIRLREFRHWDDFAASLPKRVRADLRRCLKRLNEKGHTELGWCTTVDDAAAVLSWLFANKRSWAATRGLKTHSFLKDKQVKEFFVALAHRTDLSTTPLVAFVKVDGVPVAAALNLVGRRTVEYFITTYDEAFRSYGVGIILLDFIVKWSHANGFDFDLRPFHGNYKAEWANHITSYRTRTIFLNWRGRLLEIPLLGLQIIRVLRKAREFLERLFKTIKARIDNYAMPTKAGNS
jgi:CelD/BcsL family acetyltransferase involved in cellulose biosynthesis